MIKQFRRMIKTIDIFGAPIKFNIDGQEKYNSAFGGFLTILMFATIIFFFKSKIDIFIKKSNILSEESTIFSSNPPMLILNQNNFMFAVAIEQDDLFSFTQRPYFNIEMSQIYVVNQTTKNITTTIPLRPCSLSSFKNFKNNSISFDTMKEIYERLNFKNYLCPPEQFELKLQGQYLSQIFQYITVKVTDCVNDNKTGHICAPQSAIDNQLKEKGYLRLNFYSTNYVINPQAEDYSDVFIAEDLNFQFQPGNLKKTANIFFGKNQVNSDQSLMPNTDILQENFILRDPLSTREQSITAYDSSSYDKALTLYLRSDSYQYITNRRFMKVDELLSYFGGIFQIFFLVCGLAMRIYNEKFLMLRLANKLYQFKMVVQSKNVIADQKYKEVKNLMKAVDLNKVNIIDPKLTEVTDLQKISQLGFTSRKQFFIWYFQKAVNENKIKLKLQWKYLIYILSFQKIFNNQKNQLIENGISKVENSMNIKNILNQISQIDKLKQLLLNSNQITLFDFFPKPFVSLGQEVQEYTIDESLIKEIPIINAQLKQDLLRYQKLLIAFDKVENIETKDESMRLLNVKLVHLLGKELRTIFKASLIFQAADETANQNRMISSEQKIMQEEQQIELQELLIIKENFTVEKSKVIKQSIVVKVGNDEDQKNSKS